MKIPQQVFETRTLWRAHTTSPYMKPFAKQRKFKSFPKCFEFLLNYIIVACQHIVEKNEIALSKQYEYTRFNGFSTEVLPLNTRDF